MLPPFLVEDVVEDGSLGTGAQKWWRMLNVRKKLSENLLGARKLHHVRHQIFLVAFPPYISLKQWEVTSSRILHKFLHPL